MFCTENGTLFIEKCYISHSSLTNGPSILFISTISSQTNTFNIKHFSTGLCVALISLDPSFMFQKSNNNIFSCDFISYKIKPVILIAVLFF